MQDIDIFFQTEELTAVQKLLLKEGGESKIKKPHDNKSK